MTAAATIKANIRKSLVPFVKVYHPCFISLVSICMNLLILNYYYYSQNTKWLEYFDPVLRISSVHLSYRDFIIGAALAQCNNP